METYTQLRQTLHNSGLSEDEQKNMFALLQRTHLDQRHDEAYMHCLLRPEDAVSARIPTEYGRHSATVKQQQTYYINSGANGEGMLAFLPQDLHFRSLVFVDADMTDLASSNVEKYQTLNALIASALGLEEYFAFARIVGASMRVSFVGESDEESGLFVGGHCYDYNVGLLDANKVDTSYHVQKCRPSKGLRLVYMPRADIDFEYTSLDTKLANLTALNPQTSVFGNFCHTYTPIHYAWTSASAGDTLLEKNLQIQTRGTSNASGTPAWIGPPMNEIRSPLSYIGTGPRSNNYNVQDRQILAFYWKGLLANKTSIRVDIVRHFEVIPRVQFREIIGVSRPLHDTHTMNIAKQIGSRSSPVVASSLEKDEDLKHATTSMILKADSGDSLVKAIHNILWVPGWNNPIGDFAKIMNAPQKMITEAMGIDQEEFGKKAIKYGVDTVKPLVMGMAAEAIKGYTKNAGYKKRQKIDSSNSSVLTKDEYTALTMSSPFSAVKHQLVDAEVITKVASLPSRVRQPQYEEIVNEFVQIMPENFVQRKKGEQKKNNSIPYVQHVRTMPRYLPSFNDDLYSEVEKIFGDININIDPMSTVFDEVFMYLNSILRLRSFTFEADDIQGGKEVTDAFIKDEPISLNRTQTYLPGPRLKAFDMRNMPSLEVRMFDAGINVHWKHVYSLVTILLKWFVPSDDESAKIEGIITDLTTYAATPNRPFSTGKPVQFTADYNADSLQFPFEDPQMNKNDGYGVDFIPLFTVANLKGRGNGFSVKEPILQSDTLDYEKFPGFDTFKTELYLKDKLITYELDILTKALSKICYGWALDFIKVITIMVHLTQQFTSTQGKSVTDIIKTLFDTSGPTLQLTRLGFDPLIAMNKRMLSDVVKEGKNPGSFMQHTKETSLSVLSQTAPLSLSVTTFTLQQLKAMCPSYVQSSQWYTDNGYYKVREGGTLTIKPSHTLESGNSRLDSYVRIQMSSPALEAISSPDGKFVTQKISMHHINVARFANCSPTFIRVEYDTDALNSYLDDKYSRTGQTKFLSEKENLQRTVKSMREAFLIPSLSIFNPKEMENSIQQLVERNPLHIMKAALDGKPLKVHETTGVYIIADPVVAPGDQGDVQMADVQMADGQMQIAPPVRPVEPGFKDALLDWHAVVGDFLQLFPRFESEMLSFPDDVARGQFVYAFADYFSNVTRSGETISQYIDPSYTVPYSRFVKTLTIVTFAPATQSGYMCQRQSETLTYGQFNSAFTSKAFTETLDSWKTNSSPQYIDNYADSVRGFTADQLLVLNAVRSHLIRGSVYKSYDPGFQTVSNWGFRLSQILTRKFVLPNMTILKFVQPPIITQAVPTQGPDYFRNSAFTELRAKYASLRQDVQSYQIHKALTGEDLAKLPTSTGDPFIELKQQKQFDEAVQLYHSRQLLSHFTKIQTFKLDTWIRPMLSTAYLWQKVYSLHQDVLMQLCDYASYKAMLTERIPQVPRFGKGLYCAFDLHQPVANVAQETVAAHITRLVGLLQDQLKPMCEPEQLVLLQYSKFEELEKANFSGVSPALGLLVLQQAFYLTKRGDNQQQQQTRRDIITAKFQQLFPGKDVDVLGQKDVISPYMTSLRNFVGRFVKSLTQYSRVYRGNQYIIESFLESVLGFSLAQLTGTNATNIKAAFGLPNSEFRTTIFKPQYCASGKSYYAFQQYETLARYFEMYRDKWQAIYATSVMLQTFSKEPKDVKTVQDVVNFFTAPRITQTQLLEQYVRLVSASANGLVDNDDELHLIRIVLTLKMQGDKSPGSLTQRIFEGELGTGQASWSLYDSTQMNYIYDPTHLQFERFLYTRRRPLVNKDVYEGLDQQPYIIPPNVGVKRTMTWVEQLKATILPSYPASTVVRIGTVTISPERVSDVQLDTALLQLLQFVSEIKAIFDILYVSYQTCSFKLTNDYDFRQVLLMFQSYFSNVRMNYSDTVWGVPQGQISQVFSVVNDVFTQMSLMQVRNVRLKEPQPRPDAPPKVEESELKATTFEQGVKHLVDTRYAQPGKRRVNYTGNV